MTISQSPGVDGKKQMSFWRATSHLLAGTLGAQVLVLVTFVLIARSLGPSVFGRVAALLGIAAVGKDLLDFGTSQWLSRELASRRLTGSDARNLLRRRDAFVLTICLVACACALLWGAPWEPVAALAFYVGSAVSNAGGHARLRAENRFRRSAIHLTVERLVWFVAAGLVVLSKPVPDTASAILIASMGLAYLASTLLLPRPVATTEVTGRPPVGLRALYRQSAAFGVMGLASDLQQLDASVAASLTSVAIAAEVGVASKLTGPMGLLASVISQVVFRDASAGGTHGRKTSRSALRLSGAVGTLILLVTPVLPFLAVSVLGSQYKHASAAIVIYAVGTAVAVLNQPLASILTASGADRAVSMLISGAVVSGLALGALLVDSRGAAGMGVGFLLTQVVILVGCTILHRREETHGSPSSAASADAGNRRSRNTSRGT
jgi:O-antigen/teichoic acid export membrane protein